MLSGQKLMDSRASAWVAVETSRKAVPETQTQHALVTKQIWPFSSRLVQSPFGAAAKATAAGPLRPESAQRARPHV